MSVPGAGVPLVVLDTGVIVSALIGSKDAAPYRLCRAIGAGELRLASSDPFLAELTRTVREKAADGLIRDPARAFEVALDIGYHAEHHRPAYLPWPSVADPFDWWVPDLAYVATADFIVALDPHLHDADLPIPVEVVTPGELARRLGLSPAR